MASAVLDEHEDIHSLQQHGIHVQEIDREDPGSLGAQELPPCGARAARCRINAGGVQDLPDGGRRHGDAELHQLALDRARRSTSRLIPGVAGGRPGLRRPLVSYFFAASLRCQASSVAGVTGNTSAQCRRGTIRASAANQARSAGSYRTRPACRRSTAF